MANRYWNPAGAANWNDVNSWSDTDGGATGSSVPTIDDDVFFTGTNVNDCTINSSPIMKTLTTSGYTGTITQDTTGTRVFTVAETITSTGTLKIYGNSTTARLLLRQGLTTSTTTHIPGSGFLTITLAGIETAYVDFQDCIGAGTADWDLTNQTTDSSGDCGGNSNITFTTSATQTWANADGGSWNVASNWTSRIPLPQDDVSFACAFNASKTVTPNMARAGRNIDFTGATWTTAFTFGTGAFLWYGSLTLETGMTMALSISITTMSPNVPAVIKTNGVLVNRNIRIITRSTVTLDGDYDGTGRSVIVTGGTFDTNGYALTLGASLNTDPGSITYLRDATHLIGREVTGLGTIIPGTSTVKIVGLGANPGLRIGTTLGSLNFHNVLIDIGTGETNNLEISGNNTFNDFKDIHTVAHTIAIEAGTTQTFNKFEVNGTAGNLITLQSGTVAAPSTDVHYLNKSTGGTPISCDYLDIQHSVATPSKTWYAGANSTDDQADATAGSGWIFTAPPTYNTGFLSMF